MKFDKTKKKKKEKKKKKIMMTICFYQDSRHDKPLHWIRKCLVSDMSANEMTISPNFE